MRNVRRQWQFKSHLGVVSLLLTVCTARAETPAPAASQATPATQTAPAAQTHTQTQTRSNSAPPTTPANSTAPTPAEAPATPAAPPATTPTTPPEDKAIPAPTAKKRKRHFPRPKGVFAEPLPDSHTLPSAGKLLRENWATIPEDLAEISVGAFKEPLFGLLLLGGTGLLMLVDKPLTTFLQDKVGPAFRFLRIPTIIDTPLTRGPDGPLFAFIGGWYIGSLIKKSPRGQLASLWAVKNTLYSYFFTYVVLKSLTGRNRPTPTLSAGASGAYTDDPYDWGHIHAPSFGGQITGTSFPDTHFTLYFSIATAFAEA